MGIQIITDPVQVKWPKLAKPEINDNYPSNPPTYSVRALIPKGEKALIKEIQAAVEKTVASATGKKTPELTGGLDPEDMVNGGYELRASAPANWNRQVVDENLDPIDPMVCAQKIYAGAICKVAFEVYLSKKYNKVCVGLLAVQKIKDGDPLGVPAPSADELFKPIKVSGNNPGVLD